MSDNIDPMNVRKTSVERNERIINVLLRLNYVLNTQTTVASKVMN